MNHRLVFGILVCAVACLAARTPAVGRAVSCNEARQVIGSDVEVDDAICIPQDTCLALNGLSACTQPDMVCYFCFVNRNAGVYPEGSCGWQPFFDCLQGDTVACGGMYEGHCIYWGSPPNQRLGCGGGMPYGQCEGESTWCQ